jgi:hypothetical protein
MIEKKPVDKLAAQVMRAVREETQGDPVRLGRLIDEFKKQLHEAVKEPKHDDS